MPSVFSMKFPSTAIFHNPSSTSSLVPFRRRSHPSSQISNFPHSPPPPPFEPIYYIPIAVFFSFLSRHSHVCQPPPPLCSGHATHFRTQLLPLQRARVSLAHVPRLFLARVGVRCQCVTVREPDGAAALDGAEEEEGLAAEGVGIWAQVRDVVVFTGPALRLWICSPLMSLIDTMVIGQTSSLQLAALGPGTMFCDYLCYIFMFLSIATSNMVATSLANKDEELAQQQVSMLLFLALSFGIGMFLFTKISNGVVLG